MVKKTNDISRLRSEVRTISKQIADLGKPVNNLIKPAKVEEEKVAPFVGGVTGNYWTQAGLPWV